MQISFALSELDAAVFGQITADPQEWAANAVRARIDAKKTELADAETALRRSEGKAALDTLDALVAAAVQRLGTPVTNVPDNPTLSDWRVALTLWGRIEDVTAKVNALVASSTPSKAMLGKVAKERLEYANNVLRAQLLQLKDAFGFTADDVDESLWRAAQVAKGDLSGQWPLPTGAA